MWGISGSERRFLFLLISIFSFLVSVQSDSGHSDGDTAGTGRAGGRGHRGGELMLMLMQPQ